MNFDWEWIPVLDFASRIYDIFKRLSHKDNIIEKFGFTESEATIIFIKKMEKITIISEMHSNKIKTDFTSF